MLQQVYPLDFNESKYQHLSLLNESSFIFPLFKYLKQFCELPLPLISDYEKHCQLIHVKKNKFILSPMDVNDSIFFITKGIVRGFIKDNGRDITTWFSFENEIISAFRHPNEEDSHSIEYLQALEDCDLISIPHALIAYLHTRYHEATVVARKILALQHHAASERAILARIPTAVGRFKRMQQNNSHYNNIPLRYLASYLGIRMETLCRIRSKNL